MKTCSKCLTSKPVDEFYFRNKSKGTRHPYCSECSSTYVKAHYQSNKTYYKKKARVRNDKLKTEYREWLSDYLTKHPCVDCGETECILLEFDHVTGIKKEAIANMIRMGYKRDTLQEEIDKCVVRCVSCHRRKTARERNWWNAPVS
jgi:hypothetical protein